MPVRKIPKSFRSVTGRFPSVLNGRCIGYESKLEHDYYLTLEFDRMILKYEEQPLEVPGVVNGRNVNYIPDCLITYKDSRPPLLVECKYLKELEDENEKLLLKIARLKEYANDNNLHFQLITEKDIPSAVLANYLRLYRYIKPPLKITENRDKIYAVLKTADYMTCRELLQALATSPAEQANFTPAIWHMLFVGELTTDMNTPISFDSVLRR
jgi:hypothetical protein